MPGHVLGWLSVSLLTVGATTVGGTAHAAPAATVVTCGQTIMTSTRVANDLAGCPADGLVIGADHVTVDLGGHSISGVNAPGSEGIADDGHVGVTVKDGTIVRFFLNGVALRNAGGSAVSNLTIQRIGAGGGDGDASAGVLVKDSPHTSVSRCAVTNDVDAFQSDGVDVLSSKGATIAHNHLTRNAWDGMVVFSSPGTRVSDNTLDRNQNQGLEVNGGSDHTLVAGNHADHNRAGGLVIGAASYARIRGNTLVGNAQSGLFMFDLLKSRVSDNRAYRNGDGIDLEGGQDGSARDRISNNDTSHNRGGGLVVADGADDNLVSSNLSIANQGSPGQGGGIVLFAVTGNTVRGNVANRNLDVGIGLFEGEPGDSTGNVVTRNVADANHAHGIDAVAGTVDGGGNVAHHNTPPPDCRGVVCS